MSDPQPSRTAVRASTDQARAGETSGRVRYVLAISIVLAIAILSLIVWGPLLFDK